jgi:hypothetical protein
MSERWLGVLVSSEKVTVVDAIVDGDKPIVVEADSTWSLQTGDRASAYALMYKRLADYVENNNVALVVLKGSAVSLGGMSLKHLESAELRGLLIGAAASKTSVSTVAKAHITRTFGDRKVDEYLKDDEFWKELAGKALRSGSREAGLLLLATQKARFGE